MVFFHSSFIHFLAINSKILCRYLNTFFIIQSARDLCPLTKLMDIIEYMNGQEQSRENPNEILQMHRLSLTFVIRMQ